MIYLSNQKWRSLSLRSNELPADAGPIETRPVCYVLGGYTDFAHPGNSLFTYFIQGPDEDCNSNKVGTATFRLGSLDTPVDRELYSRTGGAFLFRNTADGSIRSAILAYENGDLRLYSPNLDSYSLLSVSAEKRPVTVGSDNDTRWLTWTSAAGSPSVYRIEADGSVSKVYTAPEAGRLGVAFWSATTTYLLFTPASDSLKTQLLALDFSDNAIRTIYTTDQGLSPIALNRDSMIFDSTKIDGEPMRRYLLPLTGGEPVAIDGGDANNPQEIVATRDGGFIYNVVQVTKTGGRLVHQALRIDAAGKLLESHDQSEWIIAKIGYGTDQRRPAAGDVNVNGVAESAIRVQGFLGSREVNGHQGGKLILQNFLAETQTELTRIEEPVVIGSTYESHGAPLSRIATYSSPQVLVPLTRLSTSTTDISGAAAIEDLDVVAIDWVQGSYRRITDTPDFSERTY
ncbi:hypothetical protein ED208_00995 [Stagnimonas aquatica]|uniref:Uncharacterized protein n=1 Tax=Stagnimonas aquatica TaxID=2689987 RepID=A0A3N0VKA6_9GAMM|nr:hypothetical protein [Stagnimonas aquatica]ROH93140.1 hypothetical protein ED208_00995 [Stagnimonas aquatica]